MLYENNKYDNYDGVRNVKVWRQFMIWMKLSPDKVENKFEEKAVSIYKRTYDENKKIKLDLLDKIENVNKVRTQNHPETIELLKDDEVVWSVNIDEFNRAHKIICFDD